MKKFDVDFTETRRSNVNDFTFICCVADLLKSRSYIQFLNTID